VWEREVLGRAAEFGRDLKEFGRVCRYIEWLAGCAVSGVGWQGGAAAGVAEWRRAIRALVQKKLRKNDTGAGAQGRGGQGALLGRCWRGAFEGSGGVDVWLVSMEWLVAGGCLD
jgi:hypothetical protein